MALADRWLLPEGVKEMLPPEAHQVEMLRRNLLDLYDSWGYDLVMPPLMEYLASLLTGVGRDLDVETFKLVDQLSGHMLGIRADITPQVARIDAHRMRVEGANRLCYSGTVLHTSPAHMLASRNPLQIGAELYGHAGIESDSEVISLMIETLYRAGMQDQLILDLNHIEVFRGLVASAGLEPADVETYRELLARKALPELDTFLQSLTLDQATLAALAALPRLNGDVNVLARARELFARCAAEVIEAIDYLAELTQIISQRYPKLDLYVDLGELRGYHYHTGVVFSALTPSYGQPIAKGGRYDAIGKDFGRARPATGFSADLKTLVGLAARSTQPRSVVLAPLLQDEALLAAIETLRKQGVRVIQQLPGDVAPTHGQWLEKQGEQWQVTSL